MQFVNQRSSSHAAATIKPAGTVQSHAFGSYMHALQRHVQESSRRYRCRGSRSAASVSRHLVRCCSASDNDSLDTFYTRQHEIGDLDAEWKSFIRPRLQNTSSQHTPPLPSTSAETPPTTRSFSSVEEWDVHDEDVYMLPYQPGSFRYPENDAKASASSTFSEVQRWALAAERAYNDCTPIDMLHGRAYWSDLQQVYVILFGVGEQDTEGIYSLRALSDDGLPRETIIAFECKDDAERYSSLLEATMEHHPHVGQILPEELTNFCKEAGYSCRLEQRGSTLTPPDYNVGMTDWERSMRLREGCWYVLEEEPSSGSTCCPTSRKPQWAVHTPDVTITGLRQANVRQMLDSSHIQLAIIRARLENLLD